MLSLLLQALIHPTHSFLKDRNGTYSDYRLGLFAIALFYLAKYVWSRFPSLDHFVEALYLGNLIAVVAGITLAGIVAVILIISHFASSDGEATTRKE